MTDFKLWLEFEEVDPSSWDIENDFAIIHVDLLDGRHYGLNIWTYKFFETAINDDICKKNNLDGKYLIPPDLFVKELTRDCIQQAIADLLKKGDLEKVLNPTVLSKNYDLDR
jgi:hypothetical protein